MAAETQAETGVQPDQDKHYVLVPDSVFQSPISDSGLRIWICLKNQKKGFDPGIRRIAEACHMSINKVRRALSELCKSGLVHIEKKTKSRNRYSVNCIHNEYRAVSKMNTELYPKRIQSCIQNGHTTITKTTNETINETITPGIDSKPTPKTKPKTRQKSTPKYSQIDLDFSDSWIAWLNERGSHHAKSADRVKYAIALGKLRAKFGLNHAQLSQLKEIVATSDFWASVLISPLGLTRPWKNGTLPINSLLDEIDALHKKQAKPVDNFTRALGRVVKESIEAKDKAMSNSTDNIIIFQHPQIEGSQNV